MRFLAIVFAFLSITPIWGGENKNRDPDQIGHRNVAAGVNVYSYQRELELGKDLARDVEAEGQLLDDPVISEYVNRIGQNLVNNSDANFPVTIKVLRSKEVNAFALPGGYIFVNSALIEAADTEAELAGALAHEIGHVAARHYTRQESLRDIMSFASIPLIFVGGAPAFAIQQGLQVAGPLVALKFSRAAEGQADLLGVQYLYRAGYDPVALVDFLERVSVQQKIDPGIFAGLLSMHPSSTSRIRSLEKEIQHDLRPLDEYLVQTSEFEKIKSRLARIDRGDYIPWRPLPSPVNSLDVPPTLKRHP